QELAALKQRHAIATSASGGQYPTGDGDTVPVDEMDRQWRDAVAAVWPLSWFKKRKVTRLLQTYATGGQANPDTDLAAIREHRAIRTALDTNVLASMPTYWRGWETDIPTLEAAFELLRETRNAIVEVGQAHGNVNEVARTLSPGLKDASGNHSLVRASNAFLQTAKAFTVAWRGYSDVARTPPVPKESTAILRDAACQAALVLEKRTAIRNWITWNCVRKKAESLGLRALVNGLESSEFPANETVAMFKLAYARWYLPTVVDRREPLRAFQRFKHEDAIVEFRRLDELARQTAATHAKQAILHGLPSSDGVPRKSELGLLKHQMSLKRPSKSIREIIGGMPQTFGKLAPCLLMSPLSIAQYLPADQSQFDVVIFDEASQITTWDAIGAIARAKQTIIVGDPKQLPPTNFFGRAENDEENDELEDHERDLESILDEAQASGLPTVQLNWHYRSRHESLIAFSNWNYYGNQLVTFPSAVSDERGVTLKYIADGIYDRGKSRTNRLEAEAIVADLVTRMQRCLSRPEHERLTYGVVTFNSQQQTLIQDLLDEEQRKCSELEWFFADERIEPTAVKNLENVQGDERDVMMFSITFGYDVHGKFPVSFGAMNRDGGERR
ncbi:MAG: DNA2/NAM7 family helicase, partial [Planctomycetales bacterium]|nr:DNA2/NAM7 family helicase [Planctomycetales bacterium]